MSGTAYGTVILQVAPEAAAGGPLAFVRTGDLISLDVEHRSLELHVSDDELRTRRQSAASEAGYAKPLRGWAKLYVDARHSGRHRCGPRLPRRLVRKRRGP